MQRRPPAAASVLAMCAFPVLTKMMHANLTVWFWIKLLRTRPVAKARAWRPNFISAYDAFKAKAAEAKKGQSGEYWTEFGTWTQTQSAAARTIQRRHAFFVKEMLRELKPVLLDRTRIFGELERQIVYYRDGKQCAVCEELIRWPDLEIHHIEEYQTGGLTVIENAAPVHKDCHPRGQQASAFKMQWQAKQRAREDGSQNGPSQSIQDGDSTSPDSLNVGQHIPIQSKLPPEGARCRFRFASKEYFGTVADGRIEVDDMPHPFSSFSGASCAITQTSRNGWLDWDVLLPECEEWVPANTWRNSVNEP